MNVLEKLLAVIQDKKQVAAVNGHSTDNDTNLFEMGKAAAFQEVETLIKLKLRG